MSLDIRLKLDGDYNKNIEDIIKYIEIKYNRVTDIGTARTVLVLLKNLADLKYLDMSKYIEDNIMNSIVNLATNLVQPVKTSTTKNTTTSPTTKKEDVLRKLKQPETQENISIKDGVYRKKCTNNKDIIGIPKDTSNKQLNSDTENNVDANTTLTDERILQEGEQLILELLHRFLPELVVKMGVENNR